MPQIDNFADVRKLLESYVERGQKTGNYSLDRIKDLMARLGNPQDSYKVVHVAGTSGKTSTCYYIAALFGQAGQKIGLTVSPHVDEVNERVQISLVPLAETEFCAQLQKFISEVDNTKIKLTYFELMVAFAFWEFAQQKVDYAVVEVGLGGLLDGTNIMHRPDKICVITDIGLDHTSILGKTISEIAAQKAGIIQDHSQVFIYQQPEEVMDQVTARSKQMHAVLHEISPEPKSNFKQRNYNLAKNVFDFVAKNENWPKLNQDELDKVSNLNIPARMEEVHYQGRTIIIDGSHNGQKMEALVNGIATTYPDKTIAALVSFVQDDPLRSQAALAELKLLTNKLIITAFSGEQDTPKQSIETEEIAKLAQHAGFQQVKIVEDPQQAFRELMKQPEDLLVVTGSFYLLNHIRPLLKPKL